MGSRTRLVLVALFALVSLLTLSWYDVLPGGWTLRGLVEPHHLREAREQRERSNARLELFASQNTTLPAGSIVFLGSSTIERFPLQRLFPGKPCVNRGIGNETAVELRARLEASLPVRAPAGFVLYAGSLDFRRERQSPETVVGRIKRVVDALRKRYPDAPITLLGLLSERDIESDLRADLDRTNAAIERYAERAELGFVPMDREPLRASDGSLSESHSADRLHLSDAGYDYVARWLLEPESTVAELLAP